MKIGDKIVLKTPANTIGLEDTVYRVTALTEIRHNIYVDTIKVFPGSQSWFSRFHIDLFRVISDAEYQTWKIAKHLENYQYKGKIGSTKPLNLGDAEKLQRAYFDTEFQKVDEQIKTDLENKMNFKLGQKVKIAGGRVGVIKGFRKQGREACIAFNPDSIAGTWIAVENLESHSDTISKGTIVGIQSFNIGAKIARSFENEGITYYELEGLGGAWKEEHLEIIDFGVFEFTPGVYEVVKNGKIVAWSEEKEILDCPERDLARFIKCLIDSLKDRGLCGLSFWLNKGSYASWLESQKYYSPDEAVKILEHIRDIRSILDPLKTLTKLQYEALIDGLNKVHNAIERVKPTGE